MKKYRYFIAFFLVLFVLQFSFLPLISVYGVVPDLLLLATVSYAFLRGSAWGGFIGFALGFLLWSARIHIDADWSLFWALRGSCI